MTSDRFDADTIRRAATGRWRGILASLGIDVPASPKQHGPCPTCGGKDRFRFDDQDEQGGWLCNQCQPKAGDGFALVRNVKRCTFPQALQHVAGVLGLQPTNGETVRSIVAEYDYTDEAGALLFQVVRFHPKDFRQRRPDGNGGWIWNLKDVEPVLFRLPNVVEASSVLIVEGEKDVETAYRLGLPDRWAATCNPMGAGKWRGSYSDALAGKSVVILPDADEPGEKHGAQVAASLTDKAATVDRLTLPPGVKDLSLWAVDRTQADLQDLMDQATPWSEGAAEQSECPTDLSVALVDYTTLLSLKIPERPCYLPWLPEGGNTMVYGPRGVGKTFFQLALAVALTTGRNLWHWQCSAPVGVLYVDGEMQLDELRQRTTALMDLPPAAPLEFLTSQLVYQRCGGKDLVLTSDAMRQEVVTILDARPDIRVVVLDNISCLFSGINEDSKQDWEPINAWLIRLRHRGLATVLVHHAGKGGQQRGTSGREDSLDTVIHLAKPTGADAREGCHFELSFTKCRSVTGEAVAPLDVRLDTANGRLQWSWKALELSTLDKARKLVAEGVIGPTELAEELGINKGYACRILKKLRAEVAA